ncbi:hypothetical protein TRIUR3_31263 [Triticum urartu]|uniref:Uncharacterized protein n=2 Tax=Triticum urartu TaxID=4572 RepID=M7ZJZ2_TRIUA|nr:uncharacterized protein LOC125513978 [Triticum urartu]XP_048535179.1 uncharacterized protein LOC125513986 [Triticum urartu]EMS52655.1 hypothetical protein TRIUR3_31263 [Triticum urartu]
MALASKPCQPDLRIYKPSFTPWYPSHQEDSESRSHLLRRIHAFYLKARRRLKRHRPQHGRRVDFCCGALCVGLLDPVANIVVNSLISSCKPKPQRKGAQADLERRSLDALVAFLTRLFPNLPESLAVHYLRLADADAPVAASVIVSDHGMKRFWESEPDLIHTVPFMALKCAALAVGHPDPDRLVNAWLNISDSIDGDRHFLAWLHRPPSSCPGSNISKLAELINGVPLGYQDLSRAWRLAASRPSRPCSDPYLHTSLLSRTLQDAIHGFYLQAIARLPAGSRFHRSLLKAGYCYGPLDPVSNIIVNTIWYDAVFPPTMKLELDLDVIGTQCLHRLENRSLYGLASFLCTRYHRFDFHQALQCLVQADANLVLADPNLVLADPNIDPSTRYVLMICPPSAAPTSNVVEPQDPPDTSLEKAFLAAATAAFHPNPEAHVKLLTSCKLKSAFRLLHRRPDRLSSQDVKRLAMLLCPKSAHGCKRAFLPLPLTVYPRAKLAGIYTRISKKVNALLNAYAQMPNGDPKFELHTICGVNDRVSGPTSFPPKYGHSHVNFVATPKSPCGGAAALFFAEISNNDQDEESFCCHVALPPPCAAQIRCLYCEYIGTRIVHPVRIDFHGRESEFEKMACGKDPRNGENVPPWRAPYYSNSQIINNRRSFAENVYGRKKEDSLYDDLDEHKSVDLGSISIRQLFLEI